MSIAVKGKRFSLLDKSENYEMYICRNYYKVHVTSVNYWIKGNTIEVLDRIAKELQAYHPCGYGTRFEIVQENLEENTVIYEGSRSDSCD